MWIHAIICDKYIGMGGGLGSSVSYYFTTFHNIILSSISQHIVIGSRWFTALSFVEWWHDHDDMTTMTIRVEGWGGGVLESVSQHCHRFHWFHSGGWALVEWFLIGFVRQWFKNIQMMLFRPASQTFFNLSQNKKHQKQSFLHSKPQGCERMRSSN